MMMWHHDDDAPAGAVGCALLACWLCWPPAPAATHWLDKHTHFFMSLRLLHNIPFLRIVNVTSNKDVDGDHKCLNNRYHLKKKNY